MDYKHTCDTIYTRFQSITNNIYGFGRPFLLLQFFTRPPIFLPVHFRFYPSKWRVAWSLYKAMPVSHMSHMSPHWVSCLIRHCFECHTCNIQNHVSLYSVSNMSLYPVSHLSLWQIVSSVTHVTHVPSLRVLSVVRRPRSWTWTVRGVAPSSACCSTSSWPTTPPSCPAPSSCSSATSVRDRRCYRPSHR